ncbi:MAG: helix-hairpin-helix domain-containing protein [Hymenobacter sp.]
MRDEVHRFGITFHRDRRDAATLKTELTDVKGLGPVTADKLLSKFKSVKKIRELTEARASSRGRQSQSQKYYSPISTSRNLNQLPNSNKKAAAKNQRKQKARP